MTWRRYSRGLGGGVRYSAVVSDSLNGEQLDINRSRHRLLAVEQCVHVSTCVCEQQSGMSVESWSVSCKARCLLKVAMAIGRPRCTYSFLVQGLSTPCFVEVTKTRMAISSPWDLTYTHYQV